jgi:prophage antirepressor-like protein
MSIIEYTPSNTLAQAFPEFTQITVYGTEEEPLFPVHQVQEFLGTAQIRLDKGGYELGEDYIQIECETANGVTRLQNLLTEDGLYRVLFRTDTSVSKKFRRFTKVVMRELRLRGRVTLDGALEKLQELEATIKQRDEQLEAEHCEKVQYQRESERFYLQKMAAIERAAALEMRQIQVDTESPEYQLERLKERYLKKTYIYIARPPKAIEEEFSDFDNLEPVDDEEICFEVAFRARPDQTACAEFHLHRDIKAEQLAVKLHERNFTVMVDGKIHPRKFRGTIDELRGLFGTLI